MIELSNIKLNNYTINIKIDELNNTLFVSNDMNILNDLSKIIAGINKSSITFNNEYLYDNKSFFEKRIYIDNTKNYLNTLDSNKAYEYLKHNYNIEIDKEYFKKLVRKTHLRQNVDVKDKYIFNNNSNSLANLILSLSIDRLRIIYMPLLNINNQEIIDIFNQKKSNILFSTISKNIDNLKKYKNIIDKIVILYKDRVFELSKGEQILKIKKDYDTENVIIFKNTIFETESHIYTLNNVKEYDLIKKLKYKEIDIYEIGDDNEKI